MVERRLDIEQTEAVDRFRLALETLPVMNAPTEHLVAATQAKHPAAAPEMGANIGVPALLAQEAQIGDRRFGSGNDHDVGVRRYGGARLDEFDGDRGLEHQRVEIVEIGDACQAQDGDADGSFMG